MILPLSPSFPCLHPIPWIYQVWSRLRALAQAEFWSLSFSGTCMACILTSFRSLLQRPFSLWTFSWFSHLKLYPLLHFIPYSYLILPLHSSLFGSQHMQVVLVLKNPLPVQETLEMCCPLELREGQGGWSLFPTNKKQETQKGFRAQEGHKVLLGFILHYEPKH